MTLQDLKDAIDDMITEHGDKVLELDVMTQYSYGDHSNTQALVDFGAVFKTVVEKSYYSASHKALINDTQEIPFMEQSELLGPFIILGDEDYAEALEDVDVIPN